LLQGAGGPCLVAPRQRGSYFSLLSPDDRRWIQHDNIMALCPIVPSGGRVRAVIALKARRNALDLSRTDVQFLTAVCAAAALAHAALEQEDTATIRTLEELALQCVRCQRIEAWRPDAGTCTCGGSWQRAALPETVMGRLRLLSLLGSGGMGVVYRGQDIVLQRPVAVKTLPRLSADAAERLMDEARAMAALSHPHIAILYGADLWRGTPVLMMEYLEGGTLAERLRRDRLTIEEAFDIVRTLAEALVFMHGTNRSHGDIKPSNIGFDQHGVVKFLDFGLSRALRTEDNDLQPTGGTVAYMSPEVLGGEPPGPTADIWALSVVLFQALAGYHPFMPDDRVANRIREGALDFVRLRAAVVESLADLLSGLLSPARADRPHDATAFLERIDRVRISHGARSYA
jgi:hypothetical protein